MQYMHFVLQRKLEDDSLLQVLCGKNFFRTVGNTSYDAWSREFTLEVQHSFTKGVHNIVWGGDYTRDGFDTQVVSYTAIADPKEYDNDQGSGFVEDEITLRDDLWLTIGYRAQYNELTNYDWAGRTALVWEAAPKHFFRAAVSRAFSRPIMQDYFIREEKTPGNVTLLPDHSSLDNEHLISYELGYRGQVVRGVDLNIEGFYNQHRDLIGQEGTGVNPTYLRNVLDVDTYGVETAVSYRPYSWWLVRAFHCYEHQTKENSINETPNRLKVDPVPQHKVGLTNRLYIDDTTTLNTQLFYVDTYYDHGRVSSRMKVDPYIRFDLRLAKKLWKDIDVAAGFTNLTDPWHFEHTSDRIPRQFYVQFYYRF
jgi:outer membrane receptor protein involved in Fe transport